MYGAIWAQGKTVSPVSGREDVSSDPNPEAVLIVQAIIQE